MYPAAEFFYESPDVVAVPIVPQGELIPKEDESYNHTARVCRVGPDNKLYITLGQPFNVPAPEKTRPVQEMGPRRHHPHGSRRQEPRGLCLGHPQLGGHGLQSEGQDPVVHR